MSLPYVFLLLYSSLTIMVHGFDVAERELKLVQKLCGQATDNCLNLKKPD